MELFIADRSSDQAGDGEGLVLDLLSGKLIDAEQAPFRHHFFIDIKFQLFRETH